MSKSYSNNVIQSRFGMSSKLILKKLIFSLLFFTPFLGFFYFVLIVLGINGTILYADLIAGSLFIYLIFFIFEVSEFNSVYYEAKESYFIFKSKIINPIDSIIEYDRIKKIEVTKDPLDFLLGLRSIVISADFAESSVLRRAKIEGLNQTKAEGLKRYILDSRETWEQQKSQKVHKQTIN